MASFVETVFAVRAQMVDGSVVDLLCFTTERDAEEFRASFGVPKGVDYTRVVRRRIIGSVETVERRRLPRR